MQLSVAHTTPPRLPQNKKWWRSAMFTRSLLGLVAVLNGYLIVQMYAQREYLFAMLTLLLAGTGIYLFASRKAYSWRYVYPGLVGMGLFVLFPLFCTIGIAFTNYSAVHQLSFERAQSVILDRQFQSGNTLNFTLLGSDGHWQLQLQDSETNQALLSAPFALDNQPQRLNMVPKTADTGVTKAPLKVITQNRQALGQLTAVMPDGSELVMSSLRQFSAIKPLYTLQEDGRGLRNNQTGELYQPNDEMGFYQAVDAKGEWIAETRMSPGYTVTIGWDNFLRVLQDKGIQQPFIKIFIWTVLFAGLTVMFTLAVGMVLACLVQWQPLKGKAMYRLLLILPYAVPGFISILIFKGLFNQSFGEINMLLEQMFGLKPEWFTNPMLAKAMILIVNVWLATRT
ncbi:maltose ABC transporter permease MalF [Tolumonas auensis]|uniref:maltose ABC transporter permease MalF n=1 Tax=Tolumonas auensis TaxID=43948 RepID=UPI002AA6D838|nr:maltose ABC transporter permease MalF [Tolumonas auensis]